MNKLPLVLDFQNKVTSAVPTFPFNPDLPQIQITRITSDHAKSNNQLEVQPVERSLSFFEMALSPFDTATSSSNSPHGTPTKSSSTRNMKSSVQKKTIKKQRGCDNQDKSRVGTKLRKTTTSYVAKGDESQASELLGQEENDNGKIREEHADFPLKNSTFELKELIMSSPCTTMIGEGDGKSVGNTKSCERNVCFLNKINTDATHLNFSGLNVFIEDDEDEDSFSLPVNQKTVKFVV